MADAIWNNRFILADPGKNETVLFENTSGTMLKNGITLSESRLNFETIRMVYRLANDSCPAIKDIPMIGKNTGSTFIQLLDASFDNHSYDTAGFMLIWQCFFVDCTNTYLKSATCQYIGKTGFIDGSTTGTWTQGSNNNVPVVYKIIGINRVSGGN